MAVFSKMDRIKGDFHYEWNPDDAASVANARKMFDELKSQGWLTFYTGADGHSYHAKTFDECLKAVTYIHNTELAQHLEEAKVIQAESAKKPGLVQNAVQAVKDVFAKGGEVVAQPPMQGG